MDGRKLPVLGIIHGTVREGRKGFSISEWVYQVAEQTKLFEVRLMDLKTIALPMMNEPKMPILKVYQYQHTKDWSFLIQSCDVFIFVTAEYNFGYPAVLRNAIEYLYQEWCFKPVRIVSYGGISGGLRAATKLKDDLLSLEMIPVKAATILPFFSKQLAEDGSFVPSDTNIKSSTNLVEELNKYYNAINYNMLAAK